MKKIIAGLLVSFSLQFVIAQVPAQAEIDKMVKDAQELAKRYGNDPAVKDAKTKLPANTNAAAGSAYPAEPWAYGNVDNWKFPPKNTALLALLPKKILTKTELASFLNDLYTQLSKKIPAEVVTSVLAMTATYATDGNKMGDVAVLGWYAGHHEEAILLLLKAAIINPGNELMLNNCAALLNISGLEQKAIPILRYLLQSHPNSTMVLNNLGQAYAGLGATDTAMYYLGRCLRLAPEHPEACGTAGFIEESRGNPEKAIEYFEKSIKTGYSKPVELKLRKLRKGGRLTHLVRPHIRLPEYFNQFKYDLPAQSVSTSDAVMAEAEHNAFRKMIMQQAQKYGAMYAELAQKKMQKGLQIMKMNGVGRVLRPDEFMAQPYFELCNIMARDVLSDYKKDLSEFNNRVTKKFAEELKVIENEYQQKYKIMMDAFAARCQGGEGASHGNCPTEEEICTAKNELANTYLPVFAEKTEDWQKKGKIIFRTYFDELVYWHYLSLHPLSNDDFRMQYYVFIEQYLTMMGGLCRTRIIKPCTPTTIHLTKESNDIKEMDCPLDLGISLIIGSIELDCEKFSIEGGELLMFKYEKKFKTRESTLHFGIGINLDLDVVNVGATEYVFVKFDGNGGYSDAGIKTEVSGDTGFGPLGVKAEIGFTLGIESGWDFNEGPFKYLLSPKPEAPLNKKVKMYKPD